MGILQLPGDALANTVRFPGLGLEFELNRVAVVLFGHNIYWYGVIIGLGFLLAVLWCCRRAGEFGIRQDDILDLLIAEVPLCLVGCRAYYVLCELDQRYRNADGSLNWQSIVSIRDGGMAIYGGVIMAALVLLVFCRWRRLDFLAFADLGVQGLLIGQIIGRWGNFMNVEAFGSVTDAPWRMCSDSIANWLNGQGLLAQGQYQAILDGALGVHPTFFYESVWNLVGFALLYVVSKRYYKFDGQLFLGYVFWYGLGRFWIEGLRTDSLHLFGTAIRTSQALAFVSAAVAGGLLLYQLWFRRGQHRERYVTRLAAAGQQEKETEE